MSNSGNVDLSLFLSVLFTHIVCSTSLVQAITLAEAAGVERVVSPAALPTYPVDMIVDAMGVGTGAHMAMVVEWCNRSRGHTVSIGTPGSSGGDPVGVAHFCPNALFQPWTTYLVMWEHVVLRPSFSSVRIFFVFCCSLCYCQRFKI